MGNELRSVSSTIKLFLVQALEKQGFQELTPIQHKAIPLIIEGKDVIAESPTGTGKTLAYVLPLLNKINPELKAAQAVILAPTRELVMQIEGELQKFADGTEINSSAFIGGADMKRQLEKLKKHPKVVVGTPGRILELIQAKKLKMHEVKTIVIDEADQMLNMGFMDTVQSIMKTTLRDRQLVFCSATISGQIEEIARGLTQSPEIIRITAKDLPESKVEHLYFVCERRDKVDTLRRIIKMYEAKALVFINDNKYIDEISSKLQYKGVNLDVLFSNSTKTERETAIKRFREGKIDVLLATDIAARGLDIEGITHVIHYDLPEELEQYIHRSGRTGRMGAAGVVISILTKYEENTIQRFSKKLHIPIVRKELYGGEIVEKRPVHRNPNKNKQRSKNNTETTISVDNNTGSSKKTHRKGNHSNFRKKK